MTVLPVHSRGLGMKRAFGMLLILPFVFAACSSGPQVQVFNRPDIDTSKSRIIIFPMLLCQGNQISAAEAQNSNPIADALLAKSWAGPLGAGNTITIPKLAFDKIPMANDAVNVLIRV